MKFRPLHDRVVVKRIDAEEKTAGNSCSSPKLLHDLKILGC